jgi:hypothetical protein
LLLLGGKAEASSTRIYTLGAMNRFIVDDTNKWLYPQLITKYGDLFYLELFGTGVSRAFATPGSNRTTAMAGTPTSLAGTDLQTYDAADSVPVQQTAGGGAIIRVMDDLYLSVHLSDYANPTIPMLLTLLAASSKGNPNAYPWLPNPPVAPGSANRKLDLFVAYNIVDVARLGLALSYGSSSYQRTPNNNDAQIPTDLMGNTEARKIDNIGTSEFAFKLGGSVDIGDVASIDSGLGFTFHGLTYAPNQRSLIGGGGGNEIDADVRAMIGVTQWWEIIPAISLRYFGVSARDLADYTNGLIYNGDMGREQFFITDVSLHRFLFDLGVAGHFRPTSAIDFWGAVGYQYVRWSAEFDNTINDDPANGMVRDQNLAFSRDSISMNAMPYFRLALEARVFSWLDFRGGVIKYLRSDSVKQDQLDIHPDTMGMNNRLNTIANDYPFFDYFVGAAVHYEGFFLDLQVDPAWFGRGPNFLSGTGANMFVNASLGYRF